MVNIQAEDREKFKWGKFIHYVTALNIININ